MSLKHKIIIITTFAIAMGFLEAAVVVYMREILYPAGFEFPLSPIPVNLALTELFRELATMIMLLSIGFLAARRFSTGFAWFIYSFAIWDIFYYVFLWAILGWPESLMTWDVLFLIPTTWTGPVLAPLVLSLTMILLAMIILQKAEGGNATGGNISSRKATGRNTSSGNATGGNASSRKTTGGNTSRIPGKIWAGLILGSLVLIFGFVFDYSRHMLTHFSLLEMLQLKNPEVLQHATSYVPSRFPWEIFIPGEGLILITIGWYWRTVR